jgi:ADP-ribose pyrophosphatase YjhB (NUDIX family)
VSYWRNLRAAFGPGPLITVGAGVIVRREETVLLQRRSDDGDWSIPGGAKELGESLEQTARRELLEESGLQAVSLRFLVVCSGPQFVHAYPDGSRIEHVAAIYEATEVDGELRVDEHETLELGYFSIEGLPRMQPLSRLLLGQALEVLAATRARSATRSRGYCPGASRRPSVG